MRRDAPWPMPRWSGASWRVVWAALLTIATCLTSVTLPTRLRAQAQEPDAARDAAAREAFESGRNAYDLGRFSEALAAYERSYELSHRPLLLFNIARAAEADGRPARAIEAYEGYLQAVPDADNRAFAEARLSKLRGAAPASAPPVVSPKAAADTLAPAPMSTTAVAAEGGSTPPKREDAPQPARPVWKRAWFWGVIGAVVAGAVTAGIVVSLRDEPKRATADEHISALVSR